MPRIIQVKVSNVPIVQPHKLGLITSVLQDGEAKVVRRSLVYERRKSVASTAIGLVLPMILAAVVETLQRMVINPTNSHKR